MIKNVLLFFKPPLIPDPSPHPTAAQPSNQLVYIPIREAVDRLLDFNQCAHNNPIPAPLRNFDSKYVNAW